jgi:hypothetical protein
MNQYDPGMQQPMQRGSNGLGIAGFVVSLLGVLGGCFGGVFLCPVGVILSAFGMRRQPRGLAIAGLIIGIVGCIWLVVGLVFLGGVGLAGLGLARESMAVVPIEKSINDFYAAQHRLPNDLQELAAKYPGTPTTTRSGKPIGYKTKSADSYTLILPGFDGQLGTADDIPVEVTVSGPTSPPTTPSKP